MKRNYSIDIIKIYFALSIALSHYSPLETGRILPILTGGFLVQLFYVLSGFFLVSSFDSKKYTSAGNYTMQRIRRIYPYYIAAFIALFTLHAYWGRYSIAEYFTTLAESLPEIFLLQNCGVFAGGINYPMWQICCLIIVSHFMFSLLLWDRQLSLNLICPVLALMVITFFANASGENISFWGVEASVFYIPLVRATGYIALGMVLHGPVFRAVNYLESNNNKYLPAMASIAVILLIVLLWHNRTTNAVMIPFAFILICLIYSKNYYARILSFPWLCKLEKLSLGYYFNHALIIKIMPNIEGIFMGCSQRVYDIIFIIILTVYTVLMFLIVDRIIALLKKRSTVKTTN